MNEYETVKSLSERTGVCKATVRSRLKEMKTQVGKGKRYPASALISDGKNTRVRFEDYCDFCSNRKVLL